MSSLPLAQLRQVRGVIGSFTCGAFGQLSLTDMPPEYSLAELESTAGRVVNLFQTADEVLPGCRCLSVAFEQHQLLARRHRLGLLCVLTTAQPDRGMLDVTLRRVVRWLCGSKAPGPLESPDP